jgi:hypothetical protein
MSQLAYLIQYGANDHQNIHRFGPLLYLIFCRTYDPLEFVCCFFPSKEKLVHACERANNIMYIINVRVATKFV